MTMKRFTAPAAAILTLAGMSTASGDITGAVFVTYPVIAEDFGGASVSVIVRDLYLLSDDPKDTNLNIYNMQIADAGKVNYFQSATGTGWSPTNLGGVFDTPALRRADSFVTIGGFEQGIDRMPPQAPGAGAGTGLDPNFGGNGAPYPGDLAGWYNGSPPSLNGQVGETVVGLACLVGRFAYDGDFTLEDSTLFVTWNQGLGTPGNQAGFTVTEAFCTTCVDCDENGVWDVLDIANGTGEDCDGDGLLDACESNEDCDLDGVIDACQIGDDPSLDKNNDGVLDSCQNVSFTGLTTEIVPILDRGYLSEIPTSAVCYRVYATVDAPNAQVVGFYGNEEHELAIDAPAGFWQAPLGGDLTSTIPCDESGMFPDLRYDSWLTVNATCASNDMTLEIGIDFKTFNSGGGLVTSNGIVFVDPDQAQSLPDADGRVLLAQLTSFDGTQPTGRINVLGFNPAGEAWFAFEIEVPEPPLVDCNGNGIQDAIDISVGTSTDCSLDGIPDECQFDEFELMADCNDNGIWDVCDIAEGTSLDKDGDLSPDECCFGDIDRDGDVDVDDIIQVIINWNQEGFNYADLDGDGLVNGKDLSMVLGAFGTCE